MICAIDLIKFRCLTPDMRFASSSIGQQKRLNKTAIQVKWHVSLLSHYLPIYTSSLFVPLNARAEFASIRTKCLNLCAHHIPTLNSSIHVRITKLSRRVICRQTKQHFH